MTGEGIASAQLSADAPWPMFQHDLQHTGRSPYTGPQTATLKWRYETGDRVRSSPAIGSDGTIYVGSDDDYVYALNPDGTLKWKYETGGSVRSSPAIRSDGTVYVGSNNGYLYAINQDGTLKWKYETGKTYGTPSFISSPAIASDGTIYVGSWDFYIYALNPDGTLKWRYETGLTILSSPAIASDGTIYIGSYDKHLYALNPDGMLKWKYETDGSVYSSPVIASDGTIYIGSGYADLYAINQDGTLKWKYEINSKTSGGVYSPPAIGSDGTIYVGSGEGYLYAISPDGTKTGFYDLHDNIISPPTITSDGTVYVRSWNYLYAINPNATPKWRYMKWGYKIGGGGTSSPAIASDGTIYVGSSSCIPGELCTGYLYAITSGAPACPTCPSPSAWSECVAGKQTRTNYRCSAETNYECWGYTEEKPCMLCGDGIVDPGENCDNCPADAGCKGNLLCHEGECVVCIQSSDCVGKTVWRGEYFCSGNDRMERGSDLFGECVNHECVGSIDMRIKVEDCGDRFCQDGHCGCSEGYEACQASSRCEKIAALEEGNPCKCQFQCKSGYCGKTGVCLKALDIIFSSEKSVIEVGKGTRVTISADNTLDQDVHTKLTINLGTGASMSGVIAGQHCSGNQCTGTVTIPAKSRSEVTIDLTGESAGSVDLTATVTATIDGKPYQKSESIVTYVTESRITIPSSTIPLGLVVILIIVSSIVYVVKYRPKKIKIKKLVKKKRKKPISSVAEEIEKLADLKEKGILTKKEFERKKKQLLKKK